MEKPCSSPSATPRPRRVKRRRASRAEGKTMPIPYERIFYFSLLSSDEKKERNKVHCMVMRARETLVTVPSHRSISLRPRSGAPRAPRASRAPRAPHRCPVSGVRVTSFVTRNAAAYSVGIASHLTAESESPCPVDIYGRVKNNPRPCTICAPSVHLLKRAPPCAFLSFLCVLLRDIVISGVIRGNVLTFLNVFFTFRLQER